MLKRHFSAVLIIKGVRQQVEFSDGLPSYLKAFMNPKSSHICVNVSFKWLKEHFAWRKCLGKTLWVLDGHSTHLHCCNLLKEVTSFFFACQVTLGRHYNHWTHPFSSHSEMKPCIGCCNTATGRSPEFRLRCSLDKRGRKLHQWKSELLVLEQQRYIHLIQIQFRITFPPSNYRVTCDALRSFICLSNGSVSYIIRLNSDNNWVSKSWSD